MKSIHTDTWIVDEDLPASPALKVIRNCDANYGLTEDEIQDRNEFIRCYLLKGFELLTMIPEEEPEDNFFIPDCDVNSPEYSAFNSHDFQKNLKPFDNYGYAMKKILEHVKDLAIRHSVCSFAEDRKQLFERYDGYLNERFRHYLGYLESQYGLAEKESTKMTLRRKINQVKWRITECKNIWEQYAPWDI